MINFIFLLFILLNNVHAQNFQITYQKGEVEITRSGKPVGPPIQTGDEIKVKKGGLLVLKNEKIVLKIMQNTQIRPYLDKDGSSVVNLVKGAIFSKVNKTPFKLRMNSTTMGVRGTQFFAQKIDVSNAWMCVNEGIVNVSNSHKDDSVDVPAGQGVFIEEKVFSKPKAFKWTQGINWKMTPDEGELDQDLKLEKYDPLNHFYD